MTSLREVSGGRPIDREALLDGFLARLETRLEALRGGRFDVAGWAERQVTTGRIVRLEGPAGGSETVARDRRGRRVRGALVEAIEGDGPALDRPILAGEVTHLRLPSAGAV